jgi:hypothetical protein
VAPAAFCQREAREGIDHDEIHPHQDRYNVENSSGSRPMSSVPRRGLSSETDRKREERSR